MRKSILIPTAVNPISSAVGSMFPGALVFNSPRNRGLYNTNYHNFAPRIGAAYQATNHGVVTRRLRHFLCAQLLRKGPNIGYSQSTPWVTSLNSGLNPSSTLSGNASLRFARVLFKARGCQLEIASAV